MGSGVLRRAGHGGGDVAAAELVGVAWRGEEGPARGGGGPGGRWGAAWGVGRSRRWPAALLGGGQRRLAPARREAERERGGRRRLDWFANSEKFKGPTVKLK